MVYLPTFTINYQLNVGKYTSPMDPIGLDGSEIRCPKPVVVLVVSHKLIGLKIPTLVQDAPRALGGGFNHLFFKTPI